MEWDARAAQVWFLERAAGYYRSGEHPERGRFLAECAVTVGSYITKDGFGASLRFCAIEEAAAFAEVEGISETLRRCK